MEFSHYWTEPFEFDNTRTYDQKDVRGGYGKPRGFWLSVDGPDDWKAWCESNEWRTEALEFRMAFTVSPDADVLVLTNVDELVAFADEYGVIEHGSLHNIDWVKVAERYDGIIIAPYIWPYRLELDYIWYYGWDCASGCFWNLKMIEPVKVDA
jgi:hypothetical protein